MPYPNEHACRLKEPGNFDKFARKNCEQKHEDKCIDVIYGIKEGKSEIQALRYPKDEWSTSDARTHCKGKDGKFEAASEGKSEIQNKEVRSFVFEIEREEEQRKMVGHAAIFNEPADIGGWFSEQIEPGAFKSSIRKDDVRALFNHNPDYVLGRSTSGTLKMSEDEKGLKVSIEPPDTQFARDLAISIERGDINQMSFAFQVLEEEWIRGDKKKQDLRKIKKVKLFDVSPVTFPAYEGTDIAIRSYEAWKSEQEPELEEDQTLEAELEEKSAFELVSELEEEKQPQSNLRIYKMRKQLNQRL